MEGSLTGADVQRRYLWKSFRGKSNTIPGQAEKCSVSARNPVRLPPGIVFGISPELCSASPRNSVRLGPESAPKRQTDVMPMLKMSGAKRFRIEGCMIHLA